jgi:hypothetical protein
MPTVTDHMTATSKPSTSSTLAILLRHSPITTSSTLLVQFLVLFVSIPIGPSSELWKDIERILKQIISLKSCYLVIPEHWEDKFSRTNPEDRAQPFIDALMKIPTRDAFVVDLLTEAQVTEGGDVEHELSKRWILKDEVVD